jgi:hypothetical protein
MKTTMNDAEANASISRRSMLQLGGIGAIGGAMAIEAGGLLLSPIEAHAQALPLKVFTKAQGDLLGTLGDVLLPGAREAGMVEFVDHQLSKSVPLLIVRYFNWPGDLTAFYKEGLSALDSTSTRTSGVSFSMSTSAQQRALVGSLLGGKIDGWNDALPSRLFYLATRSDAVDVVYGTVDGFKKLNVPYMPHIVPAEKW